MAREIQATAVVNDREHRLIQAAARRSGQSVSAFIRAAALSAAVEVLKQDEQDEEGENAETGS